MRVAMGFFILPFFWSCYSFKGISIAPEVKTYSLLAPEDRSNGAPATYPVEFNESLNLKIRRETRLVLNNDDPDITFKCVVVQYEVTPQAPRGDGRANLNRLSVGIDVTFTNSKNEKENWSQRFTRFEDFAADANFNVIQGDLLRAINDLLTQDIFNKAFGNW